MNNQQQPPEVSLEEIRKYVAADMVLKEFGEFQSIELQGNRYRIVMSDGRAFFVKLAIADAGDPTDAEDRKVICPSCKREMECIGKDLYECKPCQGRTMIG